MKKIKIVLAAASAAFALILGSCAPAFSPRSESAEEAAMRSTGLSITVVVPDYANRGTGARIIAAQTAAARLSIGSDQYELLLAESTSGSRDGEPRTFAARIGGIPARRYEKVTLELYDDDGGILTRGAAFNVEVQPFAYTPVSFKCFVTGDSSVFLTLNAASAQRAVPQGEMAFYKFFGRAGVTYTLELGSVVGAPDLYLFRPDGTAARNETNAYVRSLGGQPLIYQVSPVGAGMYVVGVYAFGADASFTLTASADAAAVGTSPAQADIDAAYIDLRDADIQGALSRFTVAIAKDPVNGEANLGAALCTLATVLLDPRISSLATENLGIVGYPSTLRDILSTSWLDPVITNQESQQYFYMPRISGMEGLDGIIDQEPDGILDVNERLVAFAKYYVMHNSGLDPLKEKILGPIWDKFETAARLLASANESMKLDLTWDTFFETPEEMWDVVHMTPDNLPSVAIGKAELLVVSGLFRTIETLATLGSAYSLDLSSPDGSNLLKDFFDEFGILDADWDPTNVQGPDQIFASLQSPFSYENFLKPTADASERLAKAKDAFGEFLDSERLAFEMVSAREAGSGFMLTPAFIAYMMTNQSPTEQTIGMAKTLLNFPVMVLDEVSASLRAEPAGSRTAYFPIPSGGQAGMMDILAYAQGTKAWPTAADGATVIGYNFGAAFANPLSNFIELSINGEPVFYTRGLDSATNTYKMSRNAFGSGLAYLPYARYYIRLPDVTLGGAIDRSDLRIDDPATRISIGEFVWNDCTYPNSDPRSNNGKWDPDEYLTGSTANSYCHMRITNAVVNEGPIGELIALSKLGEYKIAGAVVDPEVYYNLNSLTRAEVLAWLNGFTDPATSPLAKFTNPANIPALLERLSHYDPAGIGNVSIHWDGSTYKDGAPIISGNSLYMAVPNRYVFHSAMPAGTPNPSGGYDSVGSFWYSLLFGG